MAAARTCRRCTRRRPWASEPAASWLLPLGLCCNQGEYGAQMRGPLALWVAAQGARRLASRPQGGGACRAGAPSGRALRGAPAPPHQSPHAACSSHHNPSCLWAALPVEEWIGWSGSATHLQLAALAQHSAAAPRQRAAVGSGSRWSPGAVWAAACRQHWRPLGRRRQAPPAGIRSPLGVLGRRLSGREAEGAWGKEGRWGAITRVGVCAGRSLPPRPPIFHRSSDHMLNSDRYRED